MSKIIIDEFKRKDKTNLIDIFYNDDVFYNLSHNELIKKINELIEKHNLNDNVEIVNNLYDENEYLLTSTTNTINEYQNS